MVTKIAKLFLNTPERMQDVNNVDETKKEPLI